MSRSPYCLQPEVCHYVHQDTHELVQAEAWGKSDTNSCRQQSAVTGDGGNEL